MSARLLEGRPVAERLRALARERSAVLASRAGMAPQLAIVRFGDDASAGVYARSVARAAERSGLAPLLLSPPAELAAATAQITELNVDDRVAGIVVAQPLPAGLDPRTVLALVDPGKDVDGATAVNAGHLARNEPALAPATALAVMELLRFYEIGVAGRRAVVVGRSPVIGRPVAALLLAADATVTVCHRRTPDLAAETRRAEILVVAAGSPGLIHPGMIGPGSAVIDCGINPTPDGVVGDVSPGAEAVAAHLSPVPGGVGPVTAMMLVSQALDVAERLAAHGE